MFTEAFLLKEALIAFKPPTRKNFGPGNDQLTHERAALHRVFAHAKEAGTQSFYLVGRKL